MSHPLIDKPTKELIDFLHKNFSVDCLFTTENYLIIREIVFRQIIRQGYKLTLKQKRDLSHIVATDMLLYLNIVYPKNFKVTNWLKFIYNWTLKTTMAIYYPDGAEKPEIFEIDDLIDSTEFIQKYFFNQIKPVYIQDQLEASDGIYRSFNILKDFIFSIIRYNKTSSKFNTIYYSVLLSIMKDKYIFLYGLSLMDKKYVQLLVNFVKVYFDKAIEKSLKNNDKMLTEMITNLPALLQYESYYEED